MREHGQTEDQELARRITTLEDLEALRALKHRYAEAVDRCVADPSAANVAAVVELFTADADADYGQFGRFQGRDGLAVFMGEVLPSVVSWTRHLMMNPILEVDGAGARGRWVALALGVFKADPQAGAQTLHVRYEDTYVKEADGWRVRAIVAHFDTPGAAG